MLRQQRQKKYYGRRDATEIKDEGGKYSQRLTLYSTPPALEITLEEFEQWGIDRLMVLDQLDLCAAQMMSPEETEKVMRPVLQKYLPLSRKSSETDYERKKDYYSHFILRLAFCRSEELRVKFVRVETALFALRYRMADQAEQRQFIESLDLEWESVSPEEQDQLATQLRATLRSVGDNDLIMGAASGDPSSSQKNQNTGTRYFKVDWDQVTNLVETRRVFVKGGKAYVPISMQFSLVKTAFIAELEKAVLVSARMLSKMDEDTRLLPVLTNLSEAKLISAYSGPSHDIDGINALTVDALSKHFPLCMKTMHRALKAKGHAKHNTRWQYGLFLKGIGLTVEESLKFWKKAFNKMTAESFDKEHRYNIRHHYGLVGGRRNYKPNGCADLQKSDHKGPDETHGCPFKYLPPDRLAQSLKDNMNLADDSINEVLQYTASRNWCLACTAVYKHTHPTDKEDYPDGIRHPNLYFERSYRLEQEQQKPSQNTGGQVATQPSLASQPA